MGWSYCGTDQYGRDIGYSIEATCDHEGCTKDIDRGLAFVCGGMHGGDDHGCGKYFCYEHLYMVTVDEYRTVQLCAKCADEFNDNNDVLDDE